MNATPTHSMSVLGGAVTQSALGDPVDNWTVIRAGVPMAVHTGRVEVATESETEPRTIRRYTARAPFWLTITAANRLRDDRTGEVYLVDTVVRNALAAIPQDLRLDLRRVT